MEELRASLHAVRAQLDPLRMKVNRGERLSGLEQRTLARALEAVTAMRDVATVASNMSRRYNAFERWLVGADSRSQEWWTESREAGAVRRERRAAGEGSATAGGDLLPGRFNADVIQYMRDYSSMTSALELWESPDGREAKRVAYSEFTAAATDTENEAFTEGPYPTFYQQAWPLAPTYAASARLSNQMVDDAFKISTAKSAGVSRTPGITTTPVDPDPRLGALIAASLGESLGRALAPVVSAFVYSSINTAGAVSDSGGYLQLGTATALKTSADATTELALGTIGLDSAAQMIAAVDEAYLSNCAFYMSRKQWTGILRLVDGQGLPLTQVSAADKTLMGFPVKVTSQTSPATASTVSGPIFGDLESAFTLRVVNGSMMLMRSFEKYAELLQTYYRSALRADVQVRDARAVCGVKYAAS